MTRVITYHSHLWNLFAEVVQLYNQCDIQTTNPSIWVYLTLISADSSKQRIISLSVITAAVWILPWLFGFTPRLAVLRTDVFNTRRILFIIQIFPVKPFKLLKNIDISTFYNQLIFIWTFLNITFIISMQNTKNFKVSILQNWSFLVSSRCFWNNIYFSKRLKFSRFLYQFFGFSLRNTIWNSFKSGHNECLQIKGRAGESDVWELDYFNV